MNSKDVDYKSKYLRFTCINLSSICEEYVKVA
jgi:hypothetical protein